jgi:hypothetical protein
MRAYIGHARRIAKKRKCKILLVPATRRVRQCRGRRGCRCAGLASVVVFVIDEALFGYHHLGRAQQRGVLPLEAPQLEARRAHRRRLLRSPILLRLPPPRRAERGANTRARRKPPRGHRAGEGASGEGGGTLARRAWRRAARRAASVRASPGSSRLRSTNQAGRRSCSGSVTRSMSKNSMNCSCASRPLLPANARNSSRIDVRLQCWMRRRHPTSGHVCRMPEEQQTRSGCARRSSIISSASLTNSSQIGVQFGSGRHACSPRLCSLPPGAQVGAGAREATVRSASSGQCAEIT